MSGVSGTALLGAPFSVCNSQVYPISTLLLPDTTIDGVPNVLAASGAQTINELRQLSGSLCRQNYRTALWWPAEDSLSDRLFQASCCAVGLRIVMLCQRTTQDV